MSRSGTQARPERMQSNEVSKQTRDLFVVLHPVNSYSLIFLDPHANIDLNKLALLSCGTVSKAQDDILLYIALCGDSKNLIAN